MQHPTGADNFGITFQRMDPEFNLSLKRHGGQPGPARPIDEGARFFSKGFDASPLGHEHLELVPNGFCFLADQGDHARFVLAHCVKLGMAALDLGVAGHYKKTFSGNHRYPVRVIDCGAGYGAWRPLSLVDGCARVARECAIRPQTAHQFSESENVRVEIEADFGWLHAASGALRDSS